MTSNTEQTYPVKVLNGFPYRITPDGYLSITWAEYRRMVARADDVLPFGQLPSDWAAWVES